MEYRDLGNTGLSVSALSLGTSPFGGVFGGVDFSECKACLDRALDLGINFIDCSPYYGLTKAESMLGRTLQGVVRDRYILATKVGRYGSNLADFDFSAERVRRSVDESLQRLGIDCIDVIQCHDIEFGDLNQVVDETIPALHGAVEQGKARLVGITGLPLKIFEEVLPRVHVDTVLSYCRYSLNDTSLERALPLFQQYGIGVISASPLSMGLLTKAGPPSWHPAPGQVKAACREVAAYCSAQGVEIEKLAVQFSVSNFDIATTLIGTSQAAQIESAISWLAEPLDEELLREVQQILAPVTNRTWQSGRPENNDVTART